MSGARVWNDLQRPPLGAEALCTGLTAGEDPAWRALEFVPSTPSTNALVVARAQAGEPEGLVVTTDDQTGGRGRLGRAWTAPARSSVAVSVLLRPPVPVPRWSWLSLIAGLAVVDTLRGVCALPAVLKWPNDVQVPGPDGELYKICGILAEVVPVGSGSVGSGSVGSGSVGSGPARSWAVVLGTGINVSQRAEELPVTTATSLAVAGSATLDRDAVLGAYLRALSVRYAAWIAATGDPRAGGVADAYRQACTTVGRRVRVELPGADPVLGLADGVDDDGRLVVLEDDGARRGYAAGDVVHIRSDEGG